VFRKWPIKHGLMSVSHAVGSLVCALGRASLRDPMIARGERLPRLGRRRLGNACCVVGPTAKVGELW
jgi:hypothetical protein